MRFLLLVPVLVVPVVAVVVLLLAATRASQDSRMRLARRLEGRRGLLRLLGAAVGGVAAGYLVVEDTLGLGLLLAAPVAALGLLVGVLAAELVVRPPDGPRRRASPTARRVTDYLPRRLGAAVLTTGVTLTVLAVVTSALGSPDDLGRPGRWLTHSCSAVETSSRGPWPGSYYTVPLLLLVGVGTLLALLVLRTTVARPPLLPGRTPGWPEVPAQAVAADHELRAQAARSVVAGLGVLLALPLAGTSALAASAVGGPVGCAPERWALVAAGLLVVAGLGVLLALPLAGTSALAASAVGGTVGCAPEWWALVAAGLLVVAGLAAAVLLWCLVVLLVGPRQPALASTGGVR
ncbi:hypothetical protein [Aquipuribacter sp. MA13-13]|uniref:hypothetical protein n=1 Tax=Aquipuribacter sp. MA13-13 TaxID=3440840 RepID=UPI003EEA6E77